MKKPKLPAHFYQRHVVEVAQDLLGKTLFFNGIEGVITETEAYRGQDDAASHAYRGITPRSEIMFGDPGYSYVYFIYGMYHCLNIVSEEKGQPAAVLIRGLKLPQIHLNGPGKICRHLGITKAHNGIHLLSDSFYVAPGIKGIAFETTPRIGIKTATDKLWRFVAKTY